MWWTSKKIPSRPYCLLINLVDSYLRLKSIQGKKLPLTRPIFRNVMDDVKTISSCSSVFLIPIIVDPIFETISSFWVTTLTLWFGWAWISVNWNRWKVQFSLWYPSNQQTSIESLPRKCHDEKFYPCPICIDGYKCSIRQCANAQFTIRTPSGGKKVSVFLHQPPKDILSSPATLVHGPTPKSKLLPASDPQERLFPAKFQRENCRLWPLHSRQEIFGLRG